MTNTEIEIVDEAEHLPALTEVADASLAVGLSRAEIDTQIMTAKRFPRELKAVANRLLSYVTLDEETAEECLYALPRGGKPIKGPSIRFAEALKASFGNCRAAARVVYVDRQEKVVIAEGVFHDLETNSASRAEVRRRIVDKKGRLFSDDMIIVTGNAACSIALRNAILGGVPKPVWRRAYEAVQKTISGDVKTLSVTRDKAVKAMAQFGVTPEQVFQALGVAGEVDVTLDHIPILRGMFAALKNGESTVEEMFSGTVKGAPSHAKVENPLSDEAPKKVEPPHDPETGEITDSVPQQGADEVPATAADGGDDVTASDGEEPPKGSDVAPTGGPASDEVGEAGTAEDAPSQDTPAQLARDFNEALGMAKAEKAIRATCDVIFKEKIEAVPNMAARDDFWLLRDAHLKRITGEKSEKAVADYCQKVIERIEGRAG